MFMCLSMICKFELDESMDVIRGTCSNIDRLIGISQRI